MRVKRKIKRKLGRNQEQCYKCGQALNASDARTVKFTFSRRTITMCADCHGILTKKPSKSSGFESARPAIDRLH